MSQVYKKTSHLRAHLRWHIGDQPYLCSWPGIQTTGHYPSPLLLYHGVCNVSQKVALENLPDLTSYIDTSASTRGRGGTGGNIAAIQYNNTIISAIQYRCEHCGKSFSRSDHLKKHSLSHHSGLPLSSNR